MNEPVQCAIVRLSPGGHLPEILIPKEIENMDKIIIVMVISVLKFVSGLRFFFRNHQMVDKDMGKR